MRYGIFVLACIFIMSCSADFHKGRSLVHLEKAKSKGYQPQIDTVFVADTVIMEAVKTDTVFHVKTDSVTYIYKDRVKISYRRVVDSVYIAAECLPDTLVREIPITVQETVYVEMGAKKFLKKYWQYILIAIFVLSVVLVRAFRSTN